MAKLLNDISLAEWALGPLKPSKTMSVASIRAVGGAPTLQLTPRGNLGSVWTPFAPSVFGGNGSEPRKTLVYTIPEDVRRHLEAIEEWCREALREAVPNIDAIWRSQIKPPGQYEASLKAKITFGGPGSCAFYDAEGRRAEEPQDWNGLAVVPQIQLRGVYVQKGGAGLILETSALMYGGRKERGAQEDVEFL